MGNRAIMRRAVATSEALKSASRSEYRRRHRVVTSTPSSILDRRTDFLGWRRRQRRLGALLLGLQNRNGQARAPAWSDGCHRVSTRPACPDLKGEMIATAASPAPSAGRGRREALSAQGPISPTPPSPWRMREAGPCQACVCCRSPTSWSPRLVGGFNGCGSALFPGSKRTNLAFGAQAGNVGLAVLVVRSRIT